MRSIFLPATSDVRLSAALLPLRVAMGVAFMFHGWPKIQNPLGWMGPGSGVPGMCQAVAAFAEFGGGIALALGFVGRIAAVGIVAVMIGALSLVHIPHSDPFVGKPGSSSAEPATIYLVCAVLFAITGPGRFSLDGLLFGSRCEVAASASVERTAPQLAGV